MPERTTDQKIEDALAQIAKATGAFCSQERRSKVFGYAALGRYVPTENGPAEIVRLRLNPGDGVVFFKGGRSANFAVDELAWVLELHGQDPEFETIAYVHPESGELFFGRGRQALVLGFNTPQKQRGFNGKIGAALYGGIWGPTKDDVERSLIQLIFQGKIN
jgi:hypothetical protein